MIGHEQVRAHNNGDCWPDMCPCCEFEDAQEGTTTLRCQNCDGVLEVGATAWADDWTVIEPGGARIETRHTCDDCADGAA